MFKTTSLILVAGMATTATADFLQERELQSINVAANIISAVRGLKFYGDTPRINFQSTLGCGACIRGGYSFCVPTNVPGA